MLTTDARIQLMRERLQAAFSPTQLDIIDDSEKHKGHAGSRDGAGHYTLVISAPSFTKKNRVDAHREIYAVLNDLIPHEVHALVIKIVTA
jgi:BolA family transcriptional regulator, general stress-responsive regulator